MKNIVILLLLFPFAFALNAQSDTTYTVQYDSVTWATYQVQYDTEGRETSRQITYYDSTALVQSLFDAAVNADNQLYDLESQLNEATRDFNFAKVDYTDQSGISYAAAIAEAKKSHVADFFRLRVGNTFFDVSANAANTQLLNDDGDERMIAKYKRNHTVLLKEIDGVDTFFSGEVELTERQDIPGVFVGRTADNTLVVLRKPN